MGWQVSLPRRWIGWRKVLDKQS